MIVLYKKRNKGVVGVQDKDGRTWHTKGAFEDRDAMKAKPFTDWDRLRVTDPPEKKGAPDGAKKTP